MDDQKILELAKEYYANKDNYSPEQQAEIERAIRNIVAERTNKPTLTDMYRNEQGNIVETYSDGSTRRVREPQVIGGYKQGSDLYEEYSDGSVKKVGGTNNNKAPSRKKAPTKDETPTKDEHDYSKDQSIPPHGYSKDQSFIPAEQLEEIKKRMEKNPKTPEEAEENRKWYENNFVAGMNNNMVNTVAGLVGQKRLAKWLGAPDDVSDEDAATIVDSLRMGGTGDKNTYDKDSLAYKGGQLASEAGKFYVANKGLQLAGEGIAGLNNMYKASKAANTPSKFAWYKGQPGKIGDVPSNVVTKPVPNKVAWEGGQVGKIGGAPKPVSTPTPAPANMSKFVWDGGKVGKIASTPKPVNSDLTNIPGIPLPAETELASKYLDVNNRMANFLGNKRITL